MQLATITALNQLNLECYQRIAEAFDDSRQAAWLGWGSVAKHLSATLGSPLQSVLDLGCGNGRFASFLHQQHLLSATTNYLGIDANSQLLTKAEVRLQQLNVPHQLHQLDVVTELLSNASLSATITPTQVVVAFGFIHHLPSQTLCATFFQALDQVLQPGGVVVVAAWQFTNDAKLMAKTATPTEAGLGAIELEANDYLLSWENGEGQAVAYRYCHQVTDQEITELTADLPWQQLDSFAADGRNGRLNHYWLWQKKAA